MDDIQPLKPDRHKPKKSFHITLKKVQAILVLAVYVGVVSFYAGPVFLIITGALSIVYVILILIHTRHKKIIDPEISHEQYQELYTLKDQYPSIGKTISQTLKEQRCITQQQYSLIMELVLQEKTNHIKSSLEIR